MKKHIFIYLVLILIVIASIGMTGCSTRNMFMNPVDPTAINTNISEEEAAIVFFKPAARSDNIVSFVWKVEESGNLKFVTSAIPGVKTLHKTTPGRHLYLAGGYFMEAELEAGKTYYAYVVRKKTAMSLLVDAARFGVHTGSLVATIVSVGGVSPFLSTMMHSANLDPYILVPVSDISSEEFKKTFANTAWHENKTFSHNFEAERKSVEWRFSKQLKDISAIPPERKILMLPEYGTDIPIL